MTPEQLETRRRRTHFVIKAKRVLGEWVPQIGPLDEDPIPKMLHQLINARAGIDIKPSATINLITQLARTKNVAETLKIYFTSADRRRRMTARRIAYRLGLIEERADDHEKHKYKYKWDEHWQWVTTYDLQLTPQIRLLAGTEVSYFGAGQFRYENEDADFYITLTSAQVRGAGVQRHKRGHPIK